MVNENGPLDADDLMMLAERAAQLPASDAEWVGILLHELQRARTHEAELLAARAVSYTHLNDPAAAQDKLVMP